MPVYVPNARLAALASANARAEQALTTVDALLRTIRANAAELHQHVQGVLKALA